MVKSWWKSKTVWLNILGVLVTVVQALQGQAWLSPSLQVAILAVLNAILRFVTSEPVTQKAAMKLQAKMIKAPRVGK